MINAKAETIDENQCLNMPLKHKDVLFYLMDIMNGRKYLIDLSLKTKIIFFSCTWNTYFKDNYKIHTCVIITTETNELTKQIHNRMPVILTKEAEKFGLTPNK